MIEHERRLMQRVLRLFRLERRLGRWPVESLFGLIARRGRCIDELMAIDAERRRRGGGADAALRDAARALAHEIDATLPRAEARAERLRADVKVLRGEGANSGMKGFSSGRFLGRG